MKYPVLAIAFATFVGAASVTPAEALAPPTFGIAPEAPLTQASAARNRRILMMQTLQQQQMRKGRGGGAGGGGGYGGGPGYGGGGYPPSGRSRGPYPQSRW